MTEQAPDSFERSSPEGSVYAANLLRFYSFDLGERTIVDLLTQWQEIYPESWVRLALIEALYQGRYKAVSVEQILAFWQRRGQPLHRFNHDFERLVCNKLPRNLAPTASPERETFPGLAERSRPSSTNVVNFPTSLKRAEPPAPIDPPEALLPEIEPESFPSARLREVLEAESKLTASGKNGASIAPLPTIRTVPVQPGAVMEPDLRRSSQTSPPPQSPKPPKKATPLAMPDFGLTPPHLSLKLRIQLAALYQPNWIVPAASPHPFYQFALARAIPPDSKPDPTGTPNQPGREAALEAVSSVAPSESHLRSIEPNLDDLKSDLWG